MRVTSKGQVTIPKEVRRRTGIRPGAEVEIEAKGGEVVMTKARRGGRSTPREEDFDAYLEKVTGVMQLGMGTDEFMELMRGE